MHRTGEVKIGGGMSFVTNALAGELVGLEEIQDGIWRLSYRRSALCFLDLRSGTPRVMAEPEAEWACPRSPSRRHRRCTRLWFTSHPSSRRRPHTMR